MARRAVKDDRADDGGLIDARRAKSSSREAKPATLQLTAMSLMKAMWCKVAAVSDVAMLQPLAPFEICVVVNPSTAQFDWSTRNASCAPPLTEQLVT